MQIGYSLVWPVGLGPLNNDDDEDGDVILELSSKFSPLSDSIKISESDPHLRFQLGDGFEQRQRPGLYVPLEEVSMSFVDSERKNLPELIAFFRSVGSATPFRMTVPGCTATTWYREEYNKDYLHGYYWKVNVKLVEKKGP